MKSYSDNDLICRFSDQGGAISDRVSDAGIINLRPHHLLCIQKFTGHGYDEAFTTHMTELVSSFVNEPGRIVKLVSGPDELCSVCPNRLAGRCSSDEKVQRMDGAVLNICGIKAADEAADATEESATRDGSMGETDTAVSDTYDWRILSKTAAALILHTEQFDKVCGDCQWFELCKNTQKGLYDE